MKDEKEIKKEKSKTIISTIWKIVENLILPLFSLTLIIVFFVYLGRYESLRNWKYVEVLTSIMVLQLIFLARIFPIKDKLQPLRLRKNIKINCYPHRHRILAKLFLYEGIRRYRDTNSMNNIIVYFVFTFSYSIYSLQSFFDIKREILVSNIIGFLPLITIFTVSFFTSYLIKPKIFEKREKLMQFENSFQTFMRYCLHQFIVEMPEIPTFDNLPYYDVRFYDFYKRAKYLKIKYAFNFLLNLNKDQVSLIKPTEFNQFLKKKEIILIDRKEIVNLTQLDKNMIEGFKEYFLGKQKFQKQ